MRIRHLFLTFLFLVTVALLGGCAGPAADSPERCYKDGQEALAAENFAEAAAAFEKAASHEDADRLLQYSRAWQALENADFPMKTPTGSCSIPAPGRRWKTPTFPLPPMASVRSAASRTVL